MKIKLFILAKEIDLLDDFLSIHWRTKLTSIPNHFCEESQDINIKREDKLTTTSGTSTININSQQVSEKQKKDAKEKMSRLSINLTIKKNIQKKPMLKPDHKKRIT